MIMYNDNNENDSQYRYSGSDIPYNTKADLQRKQHALFFQQYFLAQ